MPKLIYALFHLSPIPSSGKVVVSVDSMHHPVFSVSVDAMHYAVLLVSVDLSLYTVYLICDKHYLCLHQIMSSEYYPYRVR